MIQLLDETLQFQMSVSLELFSQIIRHEAIEIGTHHFPADVHAATFIANEIAQRNGSFDNVIAIINTCIRTRSENTGDTLIVPQYRMAYCHQVVGDMDFGMGETSLKDLFDDLAILFVAAACAVIIYGLDFVG